MDGTEASNEDEQAPVTEIQIFGICGAVGENWRDLGTVLGIESGTMHDINETHHACRERARKLLLKWKQKEGSEATVEILINALEQIERKDVIGKLRERRTVKKSSSCAGAVRGESQTREAATMDGVQRQPLRDEMNRCLQYPNLERESNNLKTQRETFINKISQLEGMHAEDEQRRENSKKKDQIIRKNNTKIADLEKTNKIQVNHIDDLTRTNEKIKTEKSYLVEEKEKMKKQIEELKAEKDEQKSKLQVQMEKQIGDLKAEKEELRLKLQAKTDQEELDQLKTQVGDLSSQIEEPITRLAERQGERRTFTLRRGFKVVLSTFSLTKIRN